MKTTEYSSYAAQILERVAIDNEMRKKSLKDPKLHNQSVIRYSAACLRLVIRKIGWPTAILVGEEASHGAWLIAQHAVHDPVFQERCLALMKACLPGEVELPDIAHLEDRVRLNNGGSQLYGTQFTLMDGEYVPSPILNRTTLHIRRKQMKLGPLKESIAKMRKMHFGKKPQRAFKEKS